MAQGNIFFLFSSITIFISSHGFGQINYSYPNNRSFTYEEGIAAFEALSEQYPQIEIVQHSRFPTDVGKPLHLATFNANGLSIDEIRESDKAILFINNAIHPGESCGLDATVKLFEYLGIHQGEFKDVIVCAIPVYNIGGMLNRGPYQRSGQPGPVECGFRGNYQHLDLNRDFIKCDSKNAQSFTRLFHELDPDYFVDTHTTNGSDHQYTLTLIASQQDKMHPLLGTYLHGKVKPYLYQTMAKEGKEMVPYVYLTGKTPFSGIKDFMEIPRYSSGYVNLFQTMAFITEAHKYKPFPQRVEHTYAFLRNLSYLASRNAAEVKELRAKVREEALIEERFKCGWELDKSTEVPFTFKGYDTVYQKSELTGQTYLAYDKSSPKTFTIPHYKRHRAQHEITYPRYYVIPQSYPEVYRRLNLNGIVVNPLENDSVMMVQAYRIDSFKTVSKPYEKHYLHSETQVTKIQTEIQCYAGDVLVSTNQPGRQYLAAVLEPQSEDSFFNWNFFDNILQQKEWFSSFAFEPIAAAWLKEHPELASRFYEKKKLDLDFASDHYKQLYWIFQHTPYYEEEYMRYPVYRIE